MFTQLSLFDLPAQLDLPVPFDPVAAAVVAVRHPEAPGESSGQEQPLAQVIVPVQLYADGRRGDAIQPLGDLARLVLAQHQLVARRREEMQRRRAEQPRKSIRVLSPA